MSDKSSQLTEVELQILGVLWELGPSPVRDIHARLQKIKGTNYSTTVKMLSVMLQKALVARTENERPHIYRAKVSRKIAGKRLMRNLIDKVYEGSATSLVMHALAAEKPSPDELDEIRELLDQMEAQS